MIHFQAQSRFTIPSLTLLTLIALTVTGCQPQKQVGLKEKVTIEVASLIYRHL